MHTRTGTPVTHISLPDVPGGRAHRHVLPGELERPWVEVAWRVRGGRQGQCASTPTWEMSHSQSGGGEWPFGYRFLERREPRRPRTTGPRCAREKAARPSCCAACSRSRSTSVRSAPARCSSSRSSPRSAPCGGPSPISSSATSTRAPGRGAQRRETRDAGDRIPSPAVCAAIREAQHPVDSARSTTSQWGSAASSHLSMISLAPKSAASLGFVPPLRAIRFPGGAYAPPPAAVLPWGPARPDGAGGDRHCELAARPHPQRSRLHGGWRVRQSPLRG